MRHDHDCIVPLELLDQLLDLRGGDGIERRRGLVHQEHLGLDRQRARDAEPLLLPAGEIERRRLEPVGDLLPERGLMQAALDHLAERDRVAHPVDARSEGDVVEDRLREGVGLLEDHADATAQHHGIDVGAVEVSPSMLTLPSIRAPRMWSFMRLRHRRKVDLPHPDGPISAVTRRSGMSSETSS